VSEVIKVAVAEDIIPPRYKNTVSDKNLATLAILYIEGIIPSDTNQFF